jgi:hypothetical protein
MGVKPQAQVFVERSPPGLRSPANRPPLFKGRWKASQPSPSMRWRRRRSRRGPHR